MVDPSDQPVTLRGCNLGNWLMIEPWMLGGCLDVPDQGQLTDILSRRFGHERGTRLLDLYRESYITPRDFALIKSFGFNLVFRTRRFLARCLLAWLLVACELLDAGVDQTHEIL